MLKPVYSCKFVTMSNFMIRKYFPFFLAVLVFSCTTKNKIPDVSNIKIDLTTQHFEDDLFNLDTSMFIVQLEQLQAKYPSFGENFLTTILNADPKWPIDSTSSYVRNFIKAYKPVYDTSKKVIKDFSYYESEIRKGLQFLKYYYPNYKAPQKVITYIGPVDGYGDILSDDAFIVGLHIHLGKNYSLYHSSFVEETYPPYLSNRFEPEYIPVNCMNNIVKDLFPEKSEDKPLVDQMVEKGKRLFLLAKLLPYTKEYKLIGYTDEQLTSCYANEANIWKLFIQNNLLQTIDNNIIKNYIGESPKTPELWDDNGKFAPGNIGAFAGWQIVKKYSQAHPSVTIQQLMQTEAETIFQNAKYKP